MARLLARENIESSIALLSLLDAAFFGQCWTRKSESDALWRIYAHENMAVRIETDRADLAKLQGVKAYDVTYVPQMSLESEVARSFSQEGRQFHSHMSFCTKRDAFAHEEEVRILSDPDVANAERSNATLGTTALMMQALRVLRDKGEITRSEFQTGMGSIESKLQPLRTFKRVSFAHVPGFIRSVMLHPLAPSWFDETLNHFCQSNGVPYRGKSKMYALELT
jgi:hypothetical protein